MVAIPTPIHWEKPRKMHHTHSYTNVGVLYCKIPCNKLVISGFTLDHRWGGIQPIWWWWWNDEWWITTATYITDMMMDYIFTHRIFLTKNLRVQLFWAILHNDDSGKYINRHIWRSDHDMSYHWNTASTELYQLEQNQLTEIEGKINIK